MNAFPIGVSALAAGQQSLALIGQNISNATTPGYHRQAVNLVSQTVDGQTGIGVDVASITRYTAPPVRTAILRANADQGAATAQLDTSQQIETTLGTSPGTIGDGIEAFFNQVEQLTTNPDDTTTRRAVLASADSLAGQFNSAASSLDQLRTDLGGQINQTVSDINDLASKIADLNTRIAGIESGGGQANDLQDQRDELIDQLSQKIDVRTVDQPNGVVNVLSSGAPVVVGEFAPKFQVAPDAGGNLVVTQQGSNTPLNFASGSLAGQLQEYNQDLPATRARLDGLAGQFIQRVNEVQATGLGTSGPLTSASGSVSVPDPTAPLAGQNLPFPIQAGQLVVGLTDTATGQRTNATIAIDPATQSLQDVAAAITSGTGGKVQATVDPATNTLQFQAQAGTAFDFAGRDTSPASGAGVSDPDTAGLLGGLGVNGLFTGTAAVGMAVRPDIMADPRLLAASRTGQPGDETNLERMAAVRDQPAINGRTLSGEYTDLATTVGADVQQQGDRQTTQAGLVQNLTAQEQSVTGVDVNEEMVHLLDAQRLVQSASQYMSVVNTALDSIMQIIK